ncbi:hypothetical protein Goarm_002026, partial [Gossypium armourianum]|nr:hypothetical protein [Gossypium armourianum]
MFSIIKGDDESEEEAIRLGSIVRVVEAKKANESEKKLVKCLLCCGPYWILLDFRAKKLRNTSWNSKVCIDTWIYKLMLNCSSGKK